MQRRHAYILALAVAITGCLFTAPVLPTILLGDWGSSQGSVTADSTQVNAAFACVTVSVPGPVRFDAADSFDVHGYLVGEPGPVRFPPDSEPIDLLGSLQPNSVPLALNLALWMLDSTGARTGSPTTITVRQGVSGGVYACPVEAARHRPPH